MTDTEKGLFETPPPKDDSFAMGEVDGEIKVLTPEQHAAAALERNAYEGDEEEDSEGEEIDLEGIAGMFDDPEADEEMSDEEVAELKADLEEDDDAAEED